MHSAILDLIPDTRLAAQIGFILEIDRLKGILRRTRILSGDRLENSAEHSWHIGIMATVLAEYANEPVDTARVVKMLLVHDIVEIDAGDTFCYDGEGELTKVDRERAAADRLFGLLPADQETEFRDLWNEFETRATPESRFAAAMDRIMPIMHNVCLHGQAWRENGVRCSQVFQRNALVAEGSQTLWDFTHSIIAAAAERGCMAD